MAAKAHCAEMEALRRGELISLKLAPQWVVPGGTRQRILTMPTV